MDNWAANERKKERRKKKDKKAKRLKRRKKESEPTQLGCFRATWKQKH
jgi:hypothetical protein